MSSPPIKTGAGPRNVTSSKYVLTSAQAKNVDIRPPYPNSADDNNDWKEDVMEEEEEWKWKWKRVKIKRELFFITHYTNRDRDTR